MARGFVGIGREAIACVHRRPRALVSRRVFVWLGATFIGGQLETGAHSVRYGTGQVFSTMLEATIVVLRKHGGEWLARVHASDRPLVSSLFSLLATAQPLNDRA